MRGYFAVGAEGISKPMNLGNLMRSAHAFGASFFFTIDAHSRIRKAPASDTSKSTGHLPLFHWSGLEAMDLPQGCQLVGVELTEAAVDLPSFMHPLQAAYVLGPERGSLSPQMQARCAHIIKIPTKFCLNIAIAGAIVLYDRHRVHGQYAERPISSVAPRSQRPRHTHGDPILRHGRRTPRDPGPAET